VRFREPECSGVEKSVTLRRYTGPTKNGSIESEPIQSADILCLQEVDEGMARSGNRGIAYEIGERLGMHVVVWQDM